MISFLRKVCEGKNDEDSHKYFTRFGKGRFENRFLISLRKNNKLKIKTSFEFANELVKLVAGIGGGKTSGIVLSKKEMSEIMSKNNIQGNSEKKKGGLFYKNNIEEQKLNSGQIMGLVENSYFSLLKIEGIDFLLKEKQNLPKPGKDADKIDDAFCVLELDIKYLPQVKETFFWDMPDAKKIEIKHALEINEIILPENEKDPVKIRENAVRKGKLLRKIKVDDNEIVREYNVEV